MKLDGFGKLYADHNACFEQPLLSHISSDTDALHPFYAINHNTQMKQKYTQARRKNIGNI